jgi:hypothetical protein
VALAFSCRLPIIPLAILRSANLKSSAGSSDYTWDIILAMVYAQVEMHYSLISASIPCLRPFLKAWNTGYLATQAGQVDRTIVDQTHSDSYALRSKSSTNPSSKRESRSYRNSRVMSFPKRLESDASTSFTVVDSIDEAGKSGQPLPSPTSPTTPRKWKLPGELPVFDPFSVPTITSIQHSNQREKADEISKPLTPVLDPSPSNQSSSDRLVIHKTIGYTVTRSE